MQQEIIEGFRLSPQQRRLWAVQQASQAPFWARCVIGIEGRLDAAILTTALEHVVAEHEILRTAFRHLTGMDMPLQVITETGAPGLEQHDWSRVDPAEQPSRLEGLLAELSHRPVDLEQGPFWHAALVDLSPTRHSLLLSLPALYADTITLHNLVHVIGRTYAACAQDQDSDDESMQYADLSEWLNDLLESEETAAGREFWHQQDLSSLPGMKLSFEHHLAEPDPDFDLRFITLPVAPELAGQIEHLAANAGSSPAVVMQACWLVLLGRLTGQTNLVLGLAGDGRNYEELEAALGLFARTLPVSSRLDPEVSFHDFLAQVDQAAQAVYEWQEYFSWEQLGDIARPGLPFSFEFQPQPEPYVSAGLTFSLERQETCLEPTKVKLVVGQQDETLVIAFYYDATLFKQTDIERLANQYLQLVISAGAHPETMPGSLDAVPAAERRQLLIDFNDTHRDYPNDRCIHQLFEAQAETNPDRPALVFEEEQLTYGALNIRANQLSHHLQTLGVGPETLVALYLERSPELMVGLFGILKAGGAYIPLDPALPPDRLAFMLEDTQAPVIVTQQSLLETLPAIAHDPHIVFLDGDWDRIAQQPTHNPDGGTQADNLVYVLFTSGSTGRPKGVAVEQRQLINYVNAIRERLNLPAAASYATVSTFAADLGHTAIFPALCGGGCLHIISQERASDPDGLADYFSRRPVDCLKIVPSHLAALLTAARPESILPRRRLVLGGEASDWALISKVQRLAPDCTIVNHYGPTETTVGVLTYQVPDEPGEYNPVSVPLGRPLANAQIYLLDAALRIVPLGAPGEITIGGAGVTRGYLNRPELTAERFIANPFSPDIASENAPSRLYRTGDLARYLPDGSLEFLGRVDNQVKIRGFRIELGEIETLLNQHPDVKDAVVLAHDDSADNAGTPTRLTSDKRLVAYIVPEPAQSPGSTDLRHYLKDRLPEPMIPTAFVLLERLPLTANGKLDTRALPAPDTARSDLAGEYVAPRDPLELQLASIWETLLNVYPVGVTANFFDLGGHSLLVVRLMAQIQQRLGHDVPLAALFQAATIDQLARLLRRQAYQLPDTPLITIQPATAAPTKPPFFCIHPSGGHVLCYINLARLLGPDQPFYGLQAPGLQGEQSPLSRVEEMAAHYIEAIEAVQPHGLYRLGGWSIGGVIAFEMARQWQQRGETVALLALLDSWAPTTAGKPTEFEDEATLLAAFLRNLGAGLVDLPRLDDDMRQAGPGERLSLVLERAIQLNLVPPDTGPEQLTRLLRVFEANIRAILDYTPPPDNSIDLMLFRAEEESDDNSQAAPDRYWSELTDGVIEVEPAPGDHYTMLAKPHVESLAGKLKTRLDRVRETGE